MRMRMVGRSKEVADFDRIWSNNDHVDLKFRTPLSTIHARKVTVFHGHCMNAFICSHNGDVVHSKWTVVSEA